MMKSLSRLLKKVLAGVAVGSLAISFTGQVSAQSTAPQTITDIVAASGGEFDRNRQDFDILLQAVLAAGLEGSLADPIADLTVFAPNDRAFIRLARDLGYKGRSEEGAFDAIVEALTVLGNGDPIGILTNVLLYHVAPESQTVHEIRNSDSVTTLLGETIVPFKRQLLDNDPDVRNPRFVEHATDIAASNGIIQTINRVLIPVDLPNTAADLGTIVDVVLASGDGFDHNPRDYDLLLAAVSAAGLVDVLADPDADFTVFAPKDIAFVRLARSLGFRGWNEADAFGFIVDALTELGNGDPIPLLTDILLYHVSPGTQPVKTVIESDTISTALADATFEPNGRSLIDGAPQLRDPKLVISASDIRTSNGIIHTINRVLIPLDVAPARRGH